MRLSSADDVSLMIGHRIIRPATGMLIAGAAIGCSHHSMVPCVLAANGPTAAHGGTASLDMDFAGAERMIDALERDSLSDAAVDSLLAVHGVAMTVDNVTRYVPRLGRADFREAIQSFVRTGRIAANTVPFGLSETRRARADVRSLIASLRQHEAQTLPYILAQLEPYAPPTGPLHLRVYFVAGGVSDGFVSDTTDAPALYANLTRAEGDCGGVLSNISHETYHVMQKAAFRHAPGLAAIADSIENVAAPERLLATVLMEGTASHVTDPARFQGDGAAMIRQRTRYQREAEPAHMRATFALFDTLYQKIARNGIAWQELYDRGFANDAPFYALGRAMAQAIERYCGVTCIPRLFEQKPIEFFRAYIRQYRAHQEIIGRFDTATENMLVPDR
jgi:hypothetical protein